MDVVVLSPDAPGGEKELEAACPICLTEDLQLEERAVVNTCMHVFCRACLLRWLDFKQSCPLCKGQVVSIFYGITSEGEFSERILPPPAPEPPQAEHGRGEAPGMALIDQPHSYNTGSAPGPEGFSRWHNRRQHRSHELGGLQSSRARSQGGAEPRPYYHRVRAMMGSAGNRADHNAAAAVELQLTTEDKDILWRRHIYSQGVYAVPLGLSSVGRPGTAAVGQQRIESWVERELKALLQSDDVSLLRSFVLGLALSYDVRKPSSSEVEDEEAARALQPFLHAQARHFWHELRCFARQPFSMLTYDRMVKYSSQRLQVDASGSSAVAKEESGFSLWQARHFPAASSRPSGQINGSQEDALPTAEAVGARGTAMAVPLSTHAEVPFPDSGRASRSRTRKRARLGNNDRRGEHQCLLHRRDGSGGICLDCAERQADQGQPPQVSLPQPRTSARLAALRPLDHSSRIFEQRPIASSQADPVLDSAAISELASMRLRELLGQNAPALPSQSPTQPGGNRIPAPRVEGTTTSDRAYDERLAEVVDLCASDSGDDSDVVVISPGESSERPDNSSPLRDAARPSSSQQERKMWLIPRNKLLRAGSGREASRA